MWFICGNLRHSFCTQDAKALLDQVTSQDADTPVGKAGQLLAGLAGLAAVSMVAWSEYALQTTGKQTHTHAQTVRCPCSITADCKHDNAWCMAHGDRWEARQQQLLPSDVSEAARLLQSVTVSLIAVHLRGQWHARHWAMFGCDAYVCDQLLPQIAAHHTLAYMGYLQL